MAGTKVKVRVLYPSAFEQLGYKTYETKKVKVGDREVEVEILGSQFETLEVSAEHATTLIGSGYAEKVIK